MSTLAPDDLATYLDLARQLRVLNERTGSRVGILPEAHLHFYGGPAPQISAPVQINGTTAWRKAEVDGVTITVFLPTTVTVAVTDPVVP